MAPRPSLPPAPKKRKLSHQDNDNIVLSIQKLEEQLAAAAASNSSLNPLADLLEVAEKSTDAKILTKAVYALYRVFVTIISKGLLLGVTDTGEARAVRAWLNDRLRCYAQLLVGLLKDEDAVLRKSSLEILFSLQKHLSTAASKVPSGSTSRPQFHVSHFRQIVHGLLFCPPSPRLRSRSKKLKSDGVQPEDDGQTDPQVRDLFVESWLSEYDDVRWFFLREAAGLLATHSKSDHPYVPHNLLSLLERLTTFPTESTELNKWWVEELGVRPPKPKSSAGDDEEGEEPDREENSSDAEDDWRKFFEEDSAAQNANADKKAPGARLHKLTIHQSVHSLNSHRAMFTRAWLTLLPFLSTGREESSKALAMRALNVMHRGVMPHLTRAVLVMDWVASCVDYGGTVGLLALNALFILMKEYNLDYPSFYTRLYAFLDRDVFHLKHRARFFRMTELFLSSTHLPVALLASFVKRLSRLSLHAPPSAIVMIIPFTYNILKRHPALMVMIHRIDDSADMAQDPFNSAEPNPALTSAIDSSLWELYTQKQHYHSAVSTLARIFEEAFTKPNYAMEDFLDHTYSTLFETEVKRKIRKEPAIAMELSERAWFPSPAEADAVITGDRVESLWTFS